MRISSVPILVHNTTDVNPRPRSGSVQFSLSTDLVVGEVVGDLRDDSAEILFQSFLQMALVSSSGVGRGVHTFMLSNRHFVCRPRRRPPPKDALKDGFAEAVVACDLPEP